MYKARRAGSKQIMYEIKLLNSEEKNITRELWERIFTEDSISFLDYYYQFKCKDNLVYLIEKDNRAAAMLQCNPYLMKVNGMEVVADYIVGVATDKDYRHQGLMAALIKNALNDMAGQGKAFTFLMPAAEAIYTPFGFRFVYSQLVYKETKDSDKRLSDVAINQEGSKENSKENSEKINTSEETKAVIVPVTEVDIDKLLRVLNKHLEKNYDVFTVRTKEYIEDLIRLYESDGGRVCCVLKNDKFEALFSWWLTDSGAEITELICFDDDKTWIVENIKRYFRSNYSADSFLFRGEVPENCGHESRIMLRIADVKSMLKLIRTDKALRIKLRIEDRLIYKNNGAFLWYVDEKHSYVKVLENADTGINNQYDLKYSLQAASYGEDEFDCELDLSIEELALWFFKGIVPKGDSDLKHIRIINRFFINEIV